MTSRSSWCSSDHEFRQSDDRKRKNQLSLMYNIYLWQNVWAMQLRSAAVTQNLIVNIMSACGNTCFLKVFKWHLDSDHYLSVFSVASSSIFCTTQIWNNAELQSVAVMQNLIVNEMLHLVITPVFKVCLNVTFLHSDHYLIEFSAVSLLYCFIEFKS